MTEDNLHVPAAAPLFDAIADKRKNHMSHTATLPQYVSTHHELMRFANLGELQGTQVFQLNDRRMTPFN